MLSTTPAFNLRPRKTTENHDITVQLQNLSDEEDFQKAARHSNARILASVPTAHIVAGLKIRTDVFT
jgi:hypothetical protein